MSQPIVTLVGTLYVLALAFGGAPAVAQDLSNPGPARNSQGQAPLEGMKTSKLLLSQAIERSEQQLGGRAVEATFTPYATGSGGHEVVVLKSDGTLTRNHIDGRSESILGVTDEKLSSVFTSLTPDAVNKGKGLLAIVREIEQKSPEQRVIGAAAEQDNENVSYEVTVATPQGDQTLHLDANGGTKPD